MSLFKRQHLAGQEFAEIELIERELVTTGVLIDFEPHKKRNEGTAIILGDDPTEEIYSVPDEGSLLNPVQIYATERGFQIYDLSNGRWYR